jgi:uncharacterized protein YgbK (DUF1537 family)
MLLGCIADDFTGASDLANTLSKNGMMTAQFNGVPASNAAECEAGVVALKTRSSPVSEAVAESLQALEWLIGQGCEQFFFKYCSTFDSTEEGNIGPVAQALMERLGVFQAIFCPAFPENGRTLYQGHLFVDGKLLNESGMETHPLTPMTDANIVRWLAKQSTSKVGLVAYDVVRRGAQAIGSALDSYRYDGTRLVVVDAISDADLAAIGGAAAEHRLVTGGSAVARGLSSNFSAAGKLGKSITRHRGVEGGSIVLSGSCSQTSQGQLAAFLQHHPGLLVTAEDVLEGRLHPKDAVDFAIAHKGQTTAIYSSADAETVAAAQRSYGREKVAAAIESFFGETSLLLTQAGYTRFVVGGGETSGAVVKALQIDQFALGAEIDPGVPALFGKSGSTDIGLALKSGNFGSKGFYEKAVEAL